jgi:hypothetical protein
MTGAQGRRVPDTGGTTMASIRTARVAAAVFALPLTAALFTGVATADSGALADDGSSAAVTHAVQDLIGGGAGGDNYGTAATAQQQATGTGNSIQSSTPQVNGSEFTAVSQGDGNTTVSFSPLWS